MSREGKRSTKAHAPPTSEFFKRSRRYVQVENSRNREERRHIRVKLERFFGDRVIISFASHPTPLSPRCFFSHSVLFPRPLLPILRKNARNARASKFTAERLIPVDETRDWRKPRSFFRRERTASPTFIERSFERTMVDLRNLGELFAADPTPPRKLLPFRMLDGRR